MAHGLVSAGPPESIKEYAACDTAGPQGRDRDRPERGPAAGAKHSWEHALPLLTMFFALEEEKSSERDGKVKRDGVWGV